VRRVPAIALSCLLLSLAGFHCPAALSEDAPVDSTSLLRARQALWRSVVLNGWGQAHNREYLKAAVFSIAEISILTGARMQHLRWRDWTGRRLAAEDEAELLFAQRREDFYLLDRNKLLWWWLWTKIICVLDAYVCGALSNFDTSWQLGLEPVLGPGPSGARGLRLSLSRTLGRPAGK